MKSMTEGRQCSGFVRGNEAGVLNGTWPSDPQHPRIPVGDNDWEYDPDHDAPFIFRLAIYRAVV